MTTLPLPPARAWRALAALCLGFFMIMLDQSIVAVALPNLQADLNASWNQVVWLSSLYLLCVVVPLLFAGRLGDRYGSKLLFCIGVGGFTLGSLGCALAPTPEVLIAARALQGLGAALLLPQNMAVINQIFPAERRGAALGVWGAIGGIAGVIAPVLGGWLAAGPGWRWVFVVNVPLGLLSLVLVAAWVPRLQHHQERRIDGPSVLTLFVGMVALIFAIQQGPQLGWKWYIWLLGIVGLGALAGFVRRQHSAELSGRDPVMPLALFTNHNFAVGASSIAMMGFAASSMMTPIMFFLQSGRGLDAQLAGLSLLPMSALSIVLSPVVGRLTDRRSPRSLAAFGFATMALGILVAAATMLFDAHLSFFLAAVVIMGVGTSFVWAPNAAAAMRSVPHSLAGSASGVYNTTQQTGSVLGAAMVGAAMQAGLASTSLSAAMGCALLLPVVALVIGLITALRLRAAT